MTEFELPQVPEIYTITTGFDDVIAERADQFFNSILNFLGYNQRARMAFTERKEYFLMEERLGQLIEGEEKYIRLLIVKDFTAASVLSRRDELNRCQVASAHYLNPIIVQILREGIVE
jgi:hypothetical protein